MNNFMCIICFDSLQSPNNIRGGIRVTTCGHAFHANCINALIREWVYKNFCFKFFECPIIYFYTPCTLKIATMTVPFVMRILLATKWIHFFTTMQLTLIRNDTESLNLQHARVTIMEFIGNRTGLLIEVKAIIQYNWSYFQNTRICNFNKGSQMFDLPWKHTKPRGKSRWNASDTMWSPFSHRLHHFKCSMVGYLKEWKWLGHKSIIKSHFYHKLQESKLSKL